MPEAFFLELEGLLPPEEPVCSEGRRPQGPHRTVVSGLWQVLVTAFRWEDCLSNSAVRVLPLTGGCGRGTRPERGMKPT